MEARVLPAGTQIAGNAQIFCAYGGGTALADRMAHMPLTIWKEAGRRCTVTVSGAAIAVQLLDGDHLLQERVVSSADQALDLAEVWKVHRPTRPTLPQPATRRPRQTAPRPSSHQPDGSAATPRAMWIDRR